jgi:hypothetical protein
VVGADPLIQNNCETVQMLIGRYWTQAAGDCYKPRTDPIGLHRRDPTPAQAQTPRPGRLI